MKIHIHDIPEDGLDLVFRQANQAWVARTLVEAFDGLLPTGAPAEASLRLFRSDTTVTVTGEVVAELQLTCDACLESYQEEVVIPIQQYLIPASAMDTSDRKVARGGAAGPYDQASPSLAGARSKLVAERRSLRSQDDDMQFGTYHGKYLELDSILRGAIVLERPIVFHCQESCRGLCDHCGINLNRERCRCHEESAPHPFAALKQITLK